MTWTERRSKYKKEEKEAAMREIEGKVRQKMEEYDFIFKEDLRWFHENPEESFKEYDTTAYIRQRLEELGIEIQDIGLETGCIALLKGAEEGPCIALRADIDALPVTEESSGPWTSRREGRMHACGHDIHMASLLGAARILRDMKDDIKGSVKFIFQPAEEINLGAKKLMKLNCLEDPRADVIFGIHNSPDVPVGAVAVKKGPLMAAVDKIFIAVKGKGGHGGIPQNNADPIVAAAAIIQSIQTIVSRNVSPLDAAVVSICSIHGGDGVVDNITPDEVRMHGTVRTYRKNVQEMVHQRLVEIVDSTARAYGCQGELDYSYELAVTENNPILHDIACRAVKAVGAEVTEPVPSTGGEDFSEYLKGGCPGLFYWVGVRNQKKDCIYSWHSPKFRADEDAVKYGAGTYAMSVFEAIGQFGSEDKIK